MTRPDEKFYTSDGKAGDVQISLTYPSSNRDGKRASLEITERISGETIAAIELNAEQLMDLMSSTSLSVSDARLPLHPHRLGKVAQNTSTRIERGSSLDPEKVRDDYLSNGWETAEVRKTNYGHNVMARRWIAAEEG